MAAPEVLFSFKFLIPKLDFEKTVYLPEGVSTVLVRYIALGMLSNEGYVEISPEVRAPANCRLVLHLPNGELPVDQFLVRTVPPLSEE